MVSIEKTLIDIENELNIKGRFKIDYNNLFLIFTKNTN